MKLRIIICKELEKSTTPVPVPRHIVVPMAVCRELNDKVLDTVTKLIDVMDKIKRDGYIIIEDPDYVLKFLGINLGENEYIKISIEEQD